MTAILFVRIESRLDAAELERRMQERRPAFVQVPGLIQKVFGRDPATDSICGLYFFTDEAAMNAYRESDLAQSIPAAYQATAVRRETYDLLFALYPEPGPQTP